MRLAIFVFGVMHISAIYGRCRTSSTSEIRGTRRPEDCKFPFKFRGKEYNSCTTAEDPDKKPWCAVQVDENGNSEGESWGHCDMTSCSTGSCSDGTKSPGSNLDSKCRACRTVSGHAAGIVSGSACQFPFEFRGTVYRDCTLAGIKPSEEQIPWCSTYTNHRGKHVMGNYGNCECNVVQVGSESDDQLGTSFVNLSITSGGGPTSKCDGVKLPKAVVEIPVDGTFLPQETYECSNPSANYVFGGEDATLQQFPFYALLGFKVRGKVQYKCGGSLINRRYVLTAAHCLPSPDELEHVALGEHDITKDCDCDTDRCNGPTQFIPPEDVIIHEDYEIEGGLSPLRRWGAWVKANDIALIRLATPVHQGPNIIPVCLPLNERALARDLRVQNLQEGFWEFTQPVTVAGFGRTENKHYFESDGAKGQADGVETLGFTDTLQKVEIQLDSNCTKIYRRITIKPEHQICAGQKGADSCKGDSGGPLVARNGENGAWYQVGLVSYGPNRCGSGTPGVYTNVASYMAWIKANLKK